MEKRGSKNNQGSAWTAIVSPAPGGKDVWGCHQRKELSRGMNMGILYIPERSCIPSRWHRFVSMGMMGHQGLSLCGMSVNVA